MKTSKLFFRIIYITIKCQTKILKLWHLQANRSPNSARNLLVHAPEAAAGDFLKKYS